MEQGKLLDLVYEYQGTPAYTHFRAWMKFEIDRLRLSNDTATGDEVLKNQGAITVLKAMMRRMEIRVPAVPTIVDGGYV